MSPLPCAQSGATVPNVAASIGRITRLDGSSGAALYSNASARVVESLALAASPPFALMQRAGLAVARLGQALAPHGRRAWIAVGPGNNGGDGLVAAAALRQAGWHVQITTCGAGTNRPPDALRAWQLWQDGGGGATELADVEQAELAIDALLGLGQHRAPEGEMAACVARLNDFQRAGVPVLAVDQPTGLLGDTGQPLGHSVVVATHTLALLTARPGLFTGDGRDLAGHIWLADLACDPSATPPSATLSSADDARRGLPMRQHQQHKGSFGDLWVLGGARGMGGAAHLASRAALAAGAGRVYVSELGADGQAPADPCWPELMQRDAHAWCAPGVLERITLVCGCGGGEAVAAELPAAIARAARLVLDADGLNAVAADPTLMRALAARRDQALSTVLTPHPLEAARLLGCSTAEVQADRLAAAQTLAHKTQAVVVLKGSGTIVASPDNVPAINPTGNARLATPGSGDVLAGWLGGLWSSQAAPPTASAHQTARQAALSAVWLHGRAAEVAPGDPGLPLPAHELIQALQRASHLTRQSAR
ncbi:NAD(P)H-hydrate dehydratase [Ideonella margarita]|uniref:Bifunctional NAD(P)H-hydrate repair enzyme n=1 Tax=Ideonella margarita TaxID=2984191 RepID=A0ABU9C338_9BURK